MHSSTSSFERVIPPLPWRGITVIVALLIIGAATAWELYVRAIGYVPTLNDTEDLWVQARRRVEPESLVIVGESRPLFDLDLDELDVTSLPDTVALPETGASSSGNCPQSGSCTHCKVT